MRAIKVYCPPGVEPPLYAFIDALDGKLKAICLIRTACLKLSNVILMQVHQKFLFVRCIRRIRNVQTYLLKKIVILEK